jgi:hypothetical protein
VVQSGTRYVTPAQRRHAGEDVEILAARALVYRSAAPAAPDRWRGAELTTTMTHEEGHASVLSAVHHYTAEVVGLHAVERSIT